MFYFILISFNVNKVFVLFFFSDVFAFFRESCAGSLSTLFSTIYRLQSTVLFLISFLVKLVSAIGCVFFLILTFNRNCLLIICSNI